MSEYAPLKPGDVVPGDIYEDCSYHPVLCTQVEEDGEVLMGISLIDATAPRSCSISHCGPVRLSIADVLEARRDLNAYRRRREAQHSELVTTSPLQPPAKG